jgi:sec-independent protein translocase protein TatA
MLGLGPTELVLILVLVLVVFGAGKLPQVFSSMGKGIREFRQASEGKNDAPDASATPGAEVPRK